MMGAEFYSFYTAIYTCAGFFGDTGLCFFYMTSIILLCQNKKWRLRFKPLAYMGRMALSNYLFQSIVCTTIFYNYGLGFYGKVGPTLGLALSVAILLIQIFISRYWLKYYQFGPMEWIWRSLTYGKLFKMKLPKTDVTNTWNDSWETGLYRHKYISLIILRTGIYGNSEIYLRLNIKQITETAK